MPRHSDHSPLPSPDDRGKEVRKCGAPGCTEPGEFRAPKGPRELTEYYWFCLDHVRAYNAAWNYYADMSEDEVEAAIRADVTWQRPTWPLGSWMSRRKNGGHYRFKDGFGFFNGQDWSSDQKNERRSKDGPEAARHAEEDKALAVMNLTRPVDAEAIKNRYKELVKLHHPDANGGDKEAEERLKVINLAYATLLNKVSA